MMTVCLHWEHYVKKCLLLDDKTNHPVFCHLYNCVTLSVTLFLGKDQGCQGCFHVGSEERGGGGGRQNILNCLSSNRFQK